MKRLLFRTALVMAFLLPMACPATAEEGTSATNQEAEISVEVPDEVEFTVNPYGIVTATDNGGTTRALIVCEDYLVSSQTAAPLSVTVAFSGSAPQGVSLASSPAQVNAKAKSLFLWLEFQRVANGETPVWSGEYTGERNQIALNSASHSVLDLPAAENGETVCAAFRVFGLMGLPAQGVWKATDAPNVSLSFEFTTITDDEAILFGAMFAEDEEVPPPLNVEEFGDDAQAFDDEDPVEGTESSDDEVPLKDAEPSDDEEPVEDAEASDDTQPVEDTEPFDDKEPVEDAESSNDTQPVEDVEPSDVAEPVEDAEASDVAEPVEAAEASDVAEPIEDAEPSDDTQPVKDAEPSDDTEPVADVEPSEDTHPVENAAASDVTESAENTNLSEDMEPAEGAEPSEDTEPAKDAEPSEDTEPAEGAEPSEDTEPAEDAEPSEDTEPAEDAEPSDGTQSAEDAEPSDVAKPVEGTAEFFQD